MGQDLEPGKLEAANPFTITGATINLTLTLPGAMLTIELLCLRGWESTK